MSTKYIANWRLPNQENSSKSDNYGLTFDGSSEYIDLGNNVFFNTNNAFSFSAWINLDAYNTNYPYIANIKTNVTDGFAIFLSNNEAGGYAGINIGSTDSSITKGKTTGNISADFLTSWNHIILTYNGSGANTLSNYSIYVNGSSVALTTTAAFSTITNVNNLGRLGSGSFYFDGSISEVAIFDYALSATQISTLYGSSSLGAGNPMALKPQPIAYYPLGDNSASNPLTQPNEAVEDASVFEFIPEDYIDCGTSLGNQLGNSYTGDITVSMWFNADTVTSDEGLFAIKTGSSFGNITFLIAGSTVRMYYNNDGTFISGSVSTNQWYNLVGVLKAGDASNTKLYLNGSAVATATTTPSSSLNFSGMETWIGNYFAGNNGFDGEISNVAVWNSDQSSEVSNIYNSGVPATTYTNTPTAWYKLDQSANWEADSSGAWQIPDAVSAYSQSFNFDAASSDYITASVNELNYASICTISFWGKKTASNKELIVGGFINSNNGIWIQWYSDGNIYFSPRGTGASNFTISYAQSYDADWHHYVGVYDGTSASNCKLYLDGNLVATGTGTPPANLPSTTGDVFQIGALGTSFFTDGSISNVSVFNEALPATGTNSVETLYNNGTPLTTAIASDNLKAWYKLDNTATFSTNWSIPDASGNGNTGTSSGMTEQNLVNNNVSALNGESSGMTSANLVLSDLTRAVPYGDGYSFNFDSASSDYIDCGDSDIFSFGNGSSDSPFTVSAWVYIEGSSSFQIFDKYPDSGSWSLREYRMLEVNSSNQVFCTLYDSSATARFDIYSDSLITRNQWEHLTITYDGRGGSSASDGVKIYINGVESNKTVNAFGTYVAMENKSTPVRIGRLGSSYADGKISNISLFDNELTSTEVLKLYSNGVPQDLANFTPQPIAWYPLGSNSFWNGSAWTVRDMSTGGSNDGTGQNIGIDGLVGDSPRSSANGVGTNNSIPENLTGSTKWSELNSWSINMSSEARVEDTP